MTKNSVESGFKYRFERRKVDKSRHFGIIGKGSTSSVFFFQHTMLVGSMELCLPESWHNEYIETLLGRATMTKRQKDAFLYTRKKHDA